MTVKVFPTVNDVGGGGAGQVITETNLAMWLKQFLGQNFVLAGFTVPASSVDLTLSVAAGEANIAGYRVVIDAATTVSCTASATNHIYLKLARDASQNVTGATFEVNTTGTAPADSVKVATSTTDASTVTSTTDARQLRALAAAQMDGAAPDQTQAPASPGTGTLTQVLSWLANRVKAITGAANWWDVPAITLATLNAHKARHANGGADALAPVDIGIQFGTIIITTSGGAGSATLTYPVAYATMPKIVGTCDGNYLVYVSGETVTSCVIHLYAASGATTQYVDWIAIGT